MKKLALLPLTLMFAANAALAANSVDLRVTGTITPSACDISLTGGDFNLGVISSNEGVTSKIT
jgi:type 1 fimbria pilin